MKTTIYLLLSALLLCHTLPAQEIPADSGQVIQCSRIHLEHKTVNPLAKRSFAAADPYYLRVYNSESGFAAFQLGRRKGNKVFLYIRLFEFNACIGKNQVVAIRLWNGNDLQLKNRLRVNCHGNIAVELDEKTIKAFAESPVAGLMIKGFQKDYEFHFNRETAMQINEDLSCLHNYKL